MKCHECQIEMERFEQDSVQGWVCPNCGWGILTSKIDGRYNEQKKYNICIQAVSAGSIDVSTIKMVARIAKVNYLTANKILIEGNYIIRDLNESEIEKIEDANIPFEINGDNNNGC